MLNRMDIYLYVDANRVLLNLINPATHILLLLSLLLLLLFLLLVQESEIIIESYNCFCFF